VSEKQATAIADFFRNFKNLDGLLDNQNGTVNYLKHSQYK